jgi:hypothetical protein
MACLRCLVNDNPADFQHDWDYREHPTKGTFHGHGFAFCVHCNHWAWDVRSAVCAARVDALQPTTA